MAGLLHRCGLSRPSALCLAALLRGATMTIADLSAATGLAPQAVSDGVRDLERLDLVVREAAPAEGRGRPVLRQRLAGSARDALRRLERTRRKALAEELALLDELHRRAG